MQINSRMVILFGVAICGFGAPLACRPKHDTALREESHTAGSRQDGSGTNRSGRSGSFGSAATGPGATGERDARTNFGRNQ